MTEETKQTRSRLFTNQKGNTTPILRAKTRTEETEPEAVERLTSIQGWDMSMPFHFVEASKEFHAGPLDSCVRCNPEKEVTTPIEAELVEAPTEEVSEEISIPESKETETKEAQPSRNTSGH